MTRTALLLSCLFAAACSVGEVGTSKTDAGGSSCKTRLSPAGAEYTHSKPVVAGNPSNAGQNCVAAGCHLKNNLGTGAAGQLASAYQYGGTVYKTGGTVPSPGAVIVLTGSGKTATAYSDTAGNFFVADDGSLPNPFAGNVAVSGCPTISSMVSQIAQNGCGGEACHIGTNPTGGKIILADQ
jgi:hypothetical protein